MIHETAVWILLATSSLGGIPYALRAELRRRVYVARERPLARVERYLDAGMMGFAAGMGLAAMITLATATLARITV